MSLTDITIYEGGTFEFWFNDTDLFSFPPNRYPFTRAICCAFDRPGASEIDLPSCAIGALQPHGRASRLRRVCRAAASWARCCAGCLRGP